MKSKRFLAWSGFIFCCLLAGNVAIASETLAGKSFDPKPLNWAKTGPVQPDSPYLKESLNSVHYLPDPAWTTGHKSVFVLPVDFPDLPGTPTTDGQLELTQAVLRDIMDNQVAAYYTLSSHGLLTLDTYVSPRVIRMSQTSAYYATNGLFSNLVAEALSGAEPWTPGSQFDHVIVVSSYLGNIPNSQANFAGIAAPGGVYLYINGAFLCTIVTHEFAHNLGLGHANRWDSPDGNPISDSGSSQAYGDFTDIMAGTSIHSINYGDCFGDLTGGALEYNDLNPWFKSLLGWIAPSEVTTVNTNGVYRVFRFDHPEAKGTLALKIVKDEIRDYWIGFRRSLPWSNSLQHGAYVLWGYKNGHITSDRLDLGESTSLAIEPGLRVGALFVDPIAGIAIQTESEGGEPPHEYLDMRITFAPAFEAHPQDQVLVPGGQVQFEVRAAGEPAGQYQWQRTRQGESTWENLMDNAVYSGTRTPILKLIASPEMDSDSFRCAVWNVAHTCSSASRPASLVFPLLTKAGKEAAPDQGTSLDGTLQEARFCGPWGVARGSDGSIYVSDNVGQCIRVLKRDESVKTLAGRAGVLGFVDGLGSAARFSYPAAIAFGQNDELLVADSWNHAIRKVSRNGEVTTLAGSLAAQNQGKPGSRDGYGIDAQFQVPLGIAVDRVGNVFVTDSWNHMIRRISSDGYVSTIAGRAGIAGFADGVGASARFRNPEGIAIGLNGEVFVADANNCAIRKIDRDGQVTTICGQPGMLEQRDGPAGVATVGIPTALSVGIWGDLYVTDTWNGSLRRISTGGIVNTMVLLPEPNQMPQNQNERVVLAGSHGILVDPEGIIYLTQSKRQVVNTRRTAIDSRLRITRQDGSVQLLWQGNALRLEEADTPSGGWRIRSMNPQSPVAIQAVENKRFFRIAR